MKFECLDLFSGIGGFALGFRDVFKTVAYCETEPRCHEILHSAMKRGDIDHAPIFEDVQTLKGNELCLRNCQVITAGFPCQDISTASHTRTGVKGRRSGLVQHVFRLCDEIPTIKVVVLENSGNIVNLGYESIAKNFHKRGFSMYWGIFNSAYCVGALHQRRRWICLGVRHETTNHTKKILVALKQPRSISDVKQWWDKWHRWKVECPTTLIAIPRCRREATTLRWRCKLLGNGVIPCMMSDSVRQLAMSVYVSKPTDLKPTSECSSIFHHVTGKSHITPFARDHGFILGPNIVNIKLKNWNQTTPIVQKFFATPGFSHWSWSFYLKFTPRGTKVLQNQLLYMLPLSNERQKTSICKTMLVNPCFVEFLMGVPMNYTKATNGV